MAFLPTRGQRKKGIKE